MLQIDHIYEFLYQEIFKDFINYHLPNGGVLLDKKILNFNNIRIFTPKIITAQKIFFHDQEPLIIPVSEEYIKLFDFPRSMDPVNFCDLAEKKQLPYVVYENEYSRDWNDIVLPILRKDPTFLKKHPSIIVTSEKSMLLSLYLKKYNMHELYYFFHGFAALDWYRGYYALNSNKSIVKQYNYDFISFNRIINNDRSYRIYLVSLLKEQGLLEKGLVSFNVTDNLFDDWRDEVADPNTKLSEHAKRHAEQHLINISKLVIDKEQLPGNASADIPRNIDSYIAPEYDKPADVDAFWHIVTETVFYYDKLHLTEKIFKPIVSKQPFMLLAAPGNLEYLRSYGFKTFDECWNESYDLETDSQYRLVAITDLMKQIVDWDAETYTNKMTQALATADYNRQHFFSKEFFNQVVDELKTNLKSGLMVLDNTRSL